MLIIPVLRIRDGVVVTDDQGHTADCVFQDPLKTARLWRVQNARSLHLEFVDDDRDVPGPPDLNLVSRLAELLDIPLQVALPDLDGSAASAVISRGAYRVVCPTDGHSDRACAAVVEQLGASRVCLRLADADRVDAPERAASLASAGARRLLIRCVDEAGGPDVPRARAIALAAASAGRCRITLAGGVGGYPDLLSATTLEPQVDSVLIRRALYRNRFPCQMIWCWHAKETVDLEQYSTASLRRD